MGPTDKISPERMKELTDELYVLAKQQAQALQGSGYFKMPKADAEQYDQRRIRIGEIWDLIGGVSAKKQL